MNRRFTFALLVALLTHSAGLAQNQEEPETPETLAEADDLSRDDSKPSRANESEPATLPFDELMQDLPVPDSEPGIFDMPVRRPSTHDLVGKGDNPRQHFIDILIGKLPADWPTEPMMVPTTYHTVGQPPRHRWSQINPQAKNLSRANRRDIYLAFNLEEIRDDQARLLKTEDEAERKKILASLKLNYEARFAIDTAYQELQLKEIELRAAKLREEVNKRAESQQEWVSAMVTLDKMRANGISTMEPAGHEHSISSNEPTWNPNAAVLRTWGLDYPLSPGTLPGIRAVLPKQSPNIPPKRNGNVLVVNETTGLVELSLGFDDGLRSGHSLEVTRRGRYIGTVRVSRTEPNRSTAQVVQKSSEGSIAPGDRVDTQVDD